MLESSVGYRGADLHVRLAQNANGDFLRMETGLPSMRELSSGSAIISPGSPWIKVAGVPR